MTRLDKDLFYARNATSENISKAIQRFLRDIKTSTYYPNLSPDVRAKLDPEPGRYAKPLDLITPNEIVKAKNWNVNNPQSSMISAVKISAIRDWLTHMRCYVKFHSVELTEDERYFSVVDFLTHSHDPNRDLQQRKKAVVPDEQKALDGGYYIFRPSLHDPKKYVRPKVNFKWNSVGRHSYELRLEVKRGNSNIGGVGHGYYFHTNGCFQLTGRYDIYFDGAPNTIIDHYVLHDDTNNAELDGIWSAIFLGKREPRVAPVALFRDRSFPEYEDLPEQGDLTSLPKEILARINQADSYYCG